MHQALAGTLFIDTISEMSARMQAELVSFSIAAPMCVSWPRQMSNLYEDMLAGDSGKILYYQTEHHPYRLPAFGDRAQSA